MPEAPEQSPDRCEWAAWAGGAPGTGRARPTASALSSPGGHSQGSRSRRLWSSRQAKGGVRGHWATWGSVECVCMLMGRLKDRPHGAR